MFFANCIDHCLSVFGSQGNPRMRVFAYTASRIYRLVRYR